MTPQLLMALQEAEYAIQLGSDGSMTVRLREWPRPETYLEGRRLHRLGLAEVPAVVAVNQAHRLAPTVLAELAAQARSRHDLPNLSVCGSNSPLSLRTPYGASDVDFVCFVPLADIWSQPERWQNWLAKAQHDVAAELSALAGREVSIGLMAQEFRHAPGMAEHLRVEELCSDYRAHQRLELVEQRIFRFLHCAPEVQHDIREVLRLASAAAKATPDSTVLYLGPRWVDVTWFLCNRARVADLMIEPTAGEARDNGPAR